MPVFGDTAAVRVRSEAATRRPTRGAAPRWQTGSAAPPALRGNPSDAAAASTDQRHRRRLGSTQHNSGQVAGQQAHRYCGSRRRCCSRRRCYRYCRHQTLGRN
eukprot:349749-Chlamydomonas_euryale.AAC.3